MTTHSPRFVVREASGYSMTRKSTLRTEVMVMDTWYCWRVVWSNLTSLTTKETNGQLSTAERWPLPLARAFAEKLAALLEDDRPVALPLWRLKWKDGQHYYESRDALVTRFLTAS